MDAKAFANIVKQIIDRSNLKCSTNIYSVFVKIDEIVYVYIYDMLDMSLPPVIRIDNCKIYFHPD